MACVAQSIRSSGLTRSLGLAAVAWVLAVPSALGQPKHELSLIEVHYQAGDRFRAESEILRFLHDRPSHPRLDEVELVRAKLYYQEGRHRESSLMLFSLLDRYPEGAAYRPGHRLLGFSQVLQGNWDEAARALRLGGAAEAELASLAELARSPPGAVDPDTAVAWSTFLPGTGFFLLDRPGRAWAAIGLNLTFTAGAAIAYQQDNLGAALVLLLVELALYTGGREAVRQEAEALLARLETGRREAWVRERGAPDLLGVGIRLDFGGR